MYIDEYCERVAPGLWGEPANALSNGAFLIASAVLLWLLSGQPASRRAPLSVWLLPLTLGIIGFCSLAFHTFATRFTASLDTFSIIAFILIGVILLLHWMWSVSWKWAWLGAPAYMAFAIGLNAAVGFALGGYLPALVGLAGFALAARFTLPKPMARFGNRLLLAATIFAVSLTLRTLDEPLCEDLPTGTHFAWHCLNATVLFLVAHTVIRAWQTRVEMAKGPRHRDPPDRQRTAVDAPSLGT